MSKTVSKEALLRMGWLTELRRQGHRKCTGSMTAGSKVCALGLLAEVAAAGGEPTMWEYTAGRAAGLSDEQTDIVWKMNDGDNETPGLTEEQRRQHTFAEIADIVESWFPT